MTAHRVRILHISDLHLGSNESGPGGYRRREVLGDAWDRNVEALLEDGPIDIICFTGDIAASGKREEYALLTAFLKELRDATDVDADNVFVVPGNHDIDRGRSEAAWKALRTITAGELEQLSRWMAGGRPLRGIAESFRDEILDRQAAYRDWVAKDLGRKELLPDNETGHARLGYRASAKGRWPFPLHIIGLDSAWLAGDDNDAQKLLLTEDQVGRLSSGLTGVRIALMHHPLTDLADGSACRRRLAANVDLLLRGHLHETEVNLSADPDHGLLELAAGCLYSSNSHPNAVQCIELTVDETGQIDQVHMRFRAWSPRGLYWHDDSSIYESAKQGRYRLVRRDGALRP